MRNTLIRIIYAVALFFAVFLLMEVLGEGTSTQTTAEMTDAFLPIVSVENGTAVFNPLHGFTSDHDAGEDRPVLTPISSDRSVNIRISMYGAALSSARAEVRDVSGERLIENEDLAMNEGNTEGDVLTGTVSFSSLVQADQEYLMIIVLEMETSSGRTAVARYETRIKWTEGDGEMEEAMSALSFAGSFHSDTFDKTRQDDLLTWLEPDDSADNNTLSRVTISSSADQVTWGDLAPEKVTEPVYSITDIQNGTIGIWGSYYVRTEPDQTEESGTSHSYYVTERYELRRGKERFYLMNYERTMDQVFDPENPEGSDGSLDIGIADPSLAVTRSDNGDTIAFVENGRLFALRSSEKMMVYLFGFGNSDTEDDRDGFNHHDIRVLNAAEDGSIDFIVYGYMNAGRHEGEVGVSFYHYSGEHHTLEEKVFVPYAGGWEVLKKRIEECSYYNSEDGKLYLSQEDRLLEVDVDACSIRTVADHLAARNAVLSESGQMAAMEEWENDAFTGNITLINLKTLQMSTITGKIGSNVIPLGFLGEDLIYGVADPDDMVTDRLGISLIPMKHVMIVDADRKVLEDYHQDGYYVTGIEVENRQVMLSRVRKEENGHYTAADDDQIVSGEEDDSTELIRTSTVTRYERIVQIPIDADLSSLRYIRPEEILYEGTRNLTVRSSGSGDEENSAENAGGDGPGPYFSWTCSGLLSAETDIREAIEEAEHYDTGTVTDSKGRYLWKKEKPDRSEIDALTVMESGAAARDSLEVCLNKLLDLEQGNGDVGEALAGGMSAEDILTSRLPDAEVLDLTGCVMDDVLYYAGAHIPVLALTDGGNAVMIAGYGPENIELYDPASGSVHLLRLSTAEENFRRAGNRFIAVIPEQEN